MSSGTTQDAVQHRSDALERVSDGVVALDYDLRYTYVNKRAAGLLDTDAESLLGQNVWDAFPDAQGTRAQDAVQQAVETGQVSSFERYNEQLERWWKVKVYPDDTGVTIVFSDITAQKRRLYELERTEALFRNTQDGLFVIDVEDGGDRFRIDQVNPAYETVTGASVGELQGKTLRALAGDADSAAIRDKCRECVREREPCEYEYALSTDGESWRETRMAPVLVDGDVTQIVGSTRDITEQKRREKELRRKTRALDKVPVGISITDPTQEDNPMTYVNEAFTEITGYDESEVIGRNCRFLQGKDTDPEHVATIRDAVEEARPVDVTLRNERKDGTPFWNQLSIAPVRADDGTLESFVGYQKDITERKEREKRLQTHELIVQAMNEVAFLVDGEKRIRFANDAALDFAGVPLSAVAGLPVASVTEELAAPDEDPQRFVDAIEALLDDEQPDVGNWVREPDGTETLSLQFHLYLESVGDVYAEQRFVPVELYDGGRGVAVVSRDITKRREKEQEIQTHLVQAQKVGQVGSWYLDLDTDDLQWSEECYRLFDIDPETPMTYDRFLERVHPDDRAAVYEAWNDALATGRYDIEHRILVDGETRWVREIAEVEFGVDGAPEGGIGVVQDITEQVQQTREIRAQKRRYEALFNSVSGAVVVTDPDGHITTYNPDFADLFGYERGDIEGAHLSTITDESTAVERLLEHTDGARESLTVNYRKHSGQVFTGESRSAPLRTRGDAVRGHVVHIVDISEAQANREQLQVLSRVLRHNIKNDMNVIQGRAELIETHGSTAVLPHVEKILEKSRSFVEMAENQHRITDCLTDTSERVDVDLAPTIRPVVSDVQARYPGVELNTELATECRARTAPEIGEAIRELVQNAIVHSDRERPSVEITLERTDTMTELTVRDDGPGIPEQEWNVLTADGEIDPLNHGTGLGLWFVNQVVRRSNGTLAFDTNDAGGTTVTVRLPAS